MSRGGRWAKWRQWSSRKEERKQHGVFFLLCLLKESLLYLGLSHFRYPRSKIWQNSAGKVRRQEWQTFCDLISNAVRSSEPNICHRGMQRWNLQVIWHLTCGLVGIRMKQAQTSACQRARLRNSFVMAHLDDRPTNSEKWIKCLMHSEGMQYVGYFSLLRGLEDFSPN